jgi:hypothetical protein
LAVGLLTMICAINRPYITIFKLGLTQ